MNSIQYNYFEFEGSTEVFFFVDFFVQFFFVTFFVFNFVSIYY